MVFVCLNVILNITTSLLKRCAQDQNAYCKYCVYIRECGLLVFTLLDGFQQYSFQGN